MIVNGFFALQESEGLYIRNPAAPPLGGVYLQPGAAAPPLVTIAGDYWSVHTDLSAIGFGAAPAPDGGSGISSIEIDATGNVYVLATHVPGPNSEHSAWGARPSGPLAITNSGLLQIVAEAGPARGVVGAHAPVGFTNTAGGVLRVYSESASAIGVVRADVNNSGLIEVQGAESIGVDDPTEFFNEGVIRVRQHDYPGYEAFALRIHDGTADGLYINTGLIDAPYAIYQELPDTSEQWADVSLQNSGTIRGTVFLGDGDSSVRNSGIIESDVHLGYLGGGSSTYDGRGGRLLGTLHLNRTNGEAWLGDFGEHVYGNWGANIIHGGAGDDRFEIRGGDNVLDGGGGDNTLSFLSATTAVWASLETKSAVNGGTMSIANFRQLLGTDYNDTLIGDGADNRLFGRWGNDRIEGGSGVDVAEWGEAARSDAWVHSVGTAGGLTTLVFGSEGRDTLSGVEIFRFADGDYEFWNIQHNHLSGFSGREDDVLISEPSTRQVAFVDMHGGPGTWGVKPVLGALPTGWAAVGSGDFTGDGWAEAIVQDGNTGALYLYNFVYLQGIVYGPPTWGTINASLTPDWKFAGVGDFTGDGTLDVVIRNEATGYIMYAEMNGDTFGQWANAANLGTRWRLVGVGDMDRDGYSDLVVQNISEGVTYYADINAGCLAGWGFVAGGLGTAWIAKEVADLNGDGYFDVVFQNPSTGDVWWVDMAGGSNAGWGVVGRLPGWEVAGSGDFRNDGSRDVLIRRPSDGTIYFADMDEGVFTGWGTVATAPGWVVV